MSPVQSYAPFVERARKFIVAVAGIAATVGTVFATADLTTKQGVIVTVLALLTAFGVYRAPNAA